MQLKINFLCRDSILAAPIVLDVALFLDLAKRVGLSGIQEWLSFYFKSPMHAPGLYPGARSVHSADEAQEHAALHAGRGADHAPRPRVLRLTLRFDLDRDWRFRRLRSIRSKHELSSPRCSAGCSSACCRRCRSSAPRTSAAACGWSTGGVADRLPPAAESSRSRSKPARRCSAACSPGSIGARHRVAGRRWRWSASSGSIGLGADSRRSSNRIRTCRRRARDFVINLLSGRGIVVRALRDQPAALRGLRRCSARCWASRSSGRRRRRRQPRSRSGLKAAVRAVSASRRLNAIRTSIAMSTMKSTRC